MVETIYTCLPHCGESGCGIRGVCDAETGICLADPIEVPDCPYECGDQYVCSEGRCLHEEGVCETDYNCAERSRCIEGVCTPAEFAPCNPNVAVSGCAAGWNCVAGAQGGLCLQNCANDAACPQDFGCQQIVAGMGSMCYYEFCARNQLNGLCQVGGQPGTCRPISAANQQPGICFDAGTVVAGGQCDSQADRRTPEGDMLSCTPGNICFGDNDDPLDPAIVDDPGFGTCTPLCVAGQQGACGEEQACVNFGNGDDPRTPDVDESLTLGICRPSNCTILGDQCNMDETCDLITFASVAGECRAVGEAAWGEPCEESEECGAEAFCANTGNGRTCLKFCDAEDQDCPFGQNCFRPNRGLVGVCI
jgi:hypothetical protein